MFSILLYTTLLIFVGTVRAQNVSSKNESSAISTVPTVNIKNGTILGAYMPYANQDHFLGIPFAQPPIGPLRFKRPVPINTSFSGVLNATSFGYACYQYGSNFPLSEDCLTLNVVRPAGLNQEDKLPVLVWVYGGGLTSGYSGSQRFNLTSLTKIGQEIGRPVITVSINYRVGVWGFLASPDIHAEGNSNAGLFDQRMAFIWIRENIAAFGGDPDKITVWGESSGAHSLGFHLHAFGGRNDHLFRAAILESGGPIGTALEPLAYYISPYENFTRTMGCLNADVKLDCLRNVSSADLFSKRVTQLWNPVVDGEFFISWPSDLMAAGASIKVPLLLGSNTDEATSFNTKGLDTDEDVFNNFFTFRSYAISPQHARTLMGLYPNDPAQNCPYYLHENITFPSLGLQFRRDASIWTDIVMTSGRRKVSETFVRNGVDVYSYRFDTPLYNAAPSDGVPHGINVDFSFQNASGTLGPLPEYQNYKDLSLNIGKAYISFVNDLDPNHGNSTLPYWPKYNIEPKNMVLNANKTYIELDSYRKEQITFINTISKEIWG